MIDYIIVFGSLLFMIIIFTLYILKKKKNKELCCKNCKK